MVVPAALSRWPRGRDSSKMMTALRWSPGMETAHGNIGGSHSAALRAENCPLSTATGSYHSPGAGFINNRSYMISANTYGVKVLETCPSKQYWWLFPDGELLDEFYFLFLNSIFYNVLSWFKVLWVKKTKDLHTSLYIVSESWNTAIETRFFLQIRNSILSHLSNFSSFICSPPDRPMTPPNVSVLSSSHQSLAFCCGQALARQRACLPPPQGLLPSSSKALQRRPLPLTVTSLQTTRMWSTEFTVSEMQVLLENSSWYKNFSPSRT